MVLRDASASKKEGGMFLETLYCILIGKDLRDREFLRPRNGFYYSVLSTRYLVLNV